MVHALREIHRTLKPGGYLIDLRPFTEFRPVAFVVDQATFAAGHIDASALHEDDHAADRSVQQLVDEGLFRHERSDSFLLYTYWKSLQEFETYMRERSVHELPQETLDRLQSMAANTSDSYQIRVELHMIIGRYIGLPEMHK